MARGKKCRDCGTNMFALSERDEPKGSWVVYSCRSNTCSTKEKVFEDKR